MRKHSQLAELVGRRLFEVDLDEETPIELNRNKAAIPAWVYIFIGYIFGYFTAALLGALYWGWLP